MQEGNEGSGDGNDSVPMNPCYWSPIPREVRPHGVDYGPDRYIVNSSIEIVSLKSFGGQTAVKDLNDEKKEEEEEEEEVPEDLAKRPPKPPYKSHGHTIWHTHHYRKGSKYVGYVKRNEKNQPTSCRHGQGKCYYNDGRCYSGAWWDDQKHGRGSETRQDGQAVFVGEFRQGLRHGRGTIKFLNGIIEKGIWKFDKKTKTIMKGNNFIQFDT